MVSAFRSSVQDEGADSMVAAFRFRVQDVGFGCIAGMEVRTRRSDLWG